MTPEPCEIRQTEDAITMENGFVRLSFDLTTPCVDELRCDPKGKRGYGPNVVYPSGKMGINKGICNEIVTRIGFGSSPGKLTPNYYMTAAKKSAKATILRDQIKEIKVEVSGIENTNPLTSKVISKETWVFTLKRGESAFKIEREEVFKRSARIRWDKLNAYIEGRVATAQGDIPYTFSGAELYPPGKSAVFSISTEEGKSVYGYGFKNYPSVGITAIEGASKIGYELGLFGTGRPRAVLNVFTIGGALEKPGALYFQGEFPIGRYGHYTSACHQVRPGDTYRSALLISLFGSEAPPVICPDYQLRGPNAPDLMKALNVCYAVNCYRAYQPWIREGFMWSGGRNGDYWDPDQGLFTMAMTAWGDPWETRYAVENLKMFLSFQLPSGDLPRVITPKGYSSPNSFWSRKDTLCPEAMAILQTYYIAKYLPENTSFLRATLPGCERAMGRILRDRTGKLVISASAFWFDSTKRAYKNTIANMWAVECLRMMSEMEDYIGEKEMALAHSEEMGDLKKAMVRPILEGGLWNPLTNHFVDWVDGSGKVHDRFALDCNFAAIAFEIATEEQLMMVMRQMKDNEDIIELMPTRNWIHPYELGTEIRILPARYENPAEVGRVAILDLWARKKLREGQKIFELIEKIAKQGLETIWLSERYKDGKPCAADDLSRFFYVRYYPEYGFVLPYITIYILYGLQADLDGGITIDPCVPQSWYRDGFGITKTIREGQRISYDYNEQGVAGWIDTETSLHLRVKVPPSLSKSKAKISVDWKRVEIIRRREMVEFSVPKGHHIWKCSSAIAPPSI
jgi:hypothetical protein